MAAICFRFDDCKLCSVLAAGLLTAFINPAIAEPGIASSPVSPSRRDFTEVSESLRDSFWRPSRLQTITSPNQLIHQFYQAPLTPERLTEGDLGCFRSQGAMVEKLSTQIIAVTLTEIGRCDDSVSGQQTRVEMKAVENEWQVIWAGQRQQCRGRFWAAAGELCP